MPWTAMLSAAVVVLLIAAITLCVRSVTTERIATRSQRLALIGALTILIAYAVCPIAILRMGTPTGWVLAAPVAALAVSAMQWPRFASRLLFVIAVAAPIVPFAGGLVLASEYEDAGFLAGLLVGGTAVVVSAPCAAVASLLRTAVAAPCEAVFAPAGWYRDITRSGTERYWNGSAWTNQTKPIE